MSEVLESNLPCPFPDCTSSDAYSITKLDGKEDLLGKCFSCGKITWNPYKDSSKPDRLRSASGSPNGNANTSPKLGTGSLNSNRSYARNTSSTYISDTRVNTVDECTAHSIRQLKHRGITRNTCEKYGVRTGVDTVNGTTPLYSLFPEYRNNNLVGYKQKFYDGTTPAYKSIGDCKDLDLFGANTIPRKGKKLFITEGELDALALYQVLKNQSTIDWSPAVVSLPTGATSAAKSISLNLELIHGYDEVILCFDSDTPGTEAAAQVCKILAGRVYVAKLSEKDANAMLLAGKSDDLKWAVLTNARKYQPDGIINGSDCWERYKDAANTESYPYPQTMSGLNEKTYGVRPGSIVTVTSGTGMGKTQFLRELKYHYFNTTDFKIADIALEEDLGDTIGGMLSLHLNKRLNLPDVSVSEAEEKRAFEEIYGSGRFTLYDYFGGMDDETLFSKLRYFAATGHKLFFLDHLSIIVSEYASAGGERERIDTIMTKLAKFVKETGSILFLVVHLKKNDGKPFEEGTIPSLDDLRGSGSIKQLSMDVLGLSRNQQHTDPICANTSELTVLKCRFTGRTGNGGYLKFDDSTGRMFPTERPMNYKQEKKSAFS